MQTPRLGPHPRQRGCPWRTRCGGKRALTHLDHRGTVLVRYLVGDVMSMTHETCPDCGRSGERLLGPVVRTKDLIKVKGMLLNPAFLFDTLAALPGLEEFQIVVTKQSPDDPYSMDEMVVRVAARDHEGDALADRVAVATADAVGVRPRVEFVRRDQIYDPSRQGKAVRLVDRRPAVS